MKKTKLLWTAIVQVQGFLVHFKINTGREVTDISGQDFQTLKVSNLSYQSLPCMVQLIKHWTLLVGAKSHSPMARMLHLKTCLLGLSSIIALKLINRVDHNLTYFKLKH